MAASHGAVLIRNGTSSGALTPWPGGRASVVVHANTWNGATASLQVLGPDGVTLITAGAATTFTADGSGIVDLAPGQVQMTVTSGPPSGLYASIARVVA